MKSTLKRESKGLEVVKMEADGLSTDRGRESRLVANGGAHLASVWKACVRARRPGVPGGCRRAGTLRRFFKSDWSA